MSRRRSATNHPDFLDSRSHFWNCSNSRSSAQRSAPWPNRSSKRETAATPCSRPNSFKVFGRHQALCEAGCGRIVWSIAELFGFLFMLRSTQGVSRLKLFYYPNPSRQLRLEGFEPPTYGFVGHCSIQLSYRRLRNALRNSPVRAGVSSKGLS